MSLDLNTIACRLDGKISDGKVMAPGPGRPPDDDSLVVALDPSAPDGLMISSRTDDDPDAWRDYVRMQLGLVEAAPLCETESGTSSDPEIEATIVKQGEWRNSKTVAYMSVSGNAATRLGTEGGDLDGALDALLRFAANLAAQLVAIVERECELFHARDGTTFADVQIAQRRATLPITSKEFKDWLVWRYWDVTRATAKAETISSALRLVRARALYNGPERPVFIRVGSLDGRLYLDLADEAGRAVEIDAEGWRVIDNPPVRFRRPAGMQALPIPVADGSIETLRPFVNVRSDTDFILAVAWALAVLRDRGPYPVLAISGEHGSAKSTCSAILRALLDPNTAPLRALPREDRDLFIAANNGHVLTFDNLSDLPHRTSDTLCRLATGGGFAVHQLYTDQDEVLFDAARPVILNGIEDIVTRPDLADRALFLTLEPIPEEQRRPEAELWAAFEEERPRILGVLLDAVVQGLKVLPETRLEKLPRMADFALWATACEGAIWPAGTFMGAYWTSIANAAWSVIETDPVAEATQVFMEERFFWKGTTTHLLAELARIAPEDVRRMRANQLSGHIRRAAPALRRTGIGIQFTTEGHKNLRLITLSRRPEKGTDGSLASLAYQKHPESTSMSNGLSATDASDIGGASPADSAALDASDGRNVREDASDGTARTETEGFQPLGHFASKRGRRAGAVAVCTAEWFLIPCGDGASGRS